MRGQLLLGLVAFLLVEGCTPVLLAPEGHGSPPPPSVSPSAASPLTSPTPSPAPPRTASVNVSGDLLWHNSLWASARLDARRSGEPEFDFVPQLASLRSYVSSADLAICHSEVPFAKPGGPYYNYPLFAVPQEIAPAIREIGWDLCTTASNHTMDQGWAGLVRTLEVHHDNGILTAGSYATEEDAVAPVIFTTEGGVRIAVVSQTYGLNGLPKAEGKPWSIELLDPDVAIAHARRAREAGAEIVLVHMHAGDEYSSEINAQQRTFAEAVTASPDVDMVFGQHAHVVQPIDVVNGKWVIYGSGNLIAASGPAQPRTYDGFMAQVTFTEQPDGSFRATAAEFAPTMITKHSRGTPARVYLIPDELERGTDLEQAMRESAERTRDTVRSLEVAGLTERA
ncbi:MAG TPA: CapA family protein [Arachnia sp.]|nr:CapA family protein [Arachnia sp.]HMT85024.1 CapA family protein [Arachnia sp.]